jgi:oxygen-independent coproporphyrinogen-3 oxidase
MEEWLGYGPAAASQWRGRRFQNPANLKLWLQGLEACVSGRGREGREPVVVRGEPLLNEHLVREQVVELTPEILLADSIIFGLRKNEGVNPLELVGRFGIEIPPGLRDFVSRLIAEGWLSQHSGRWCLTLEGRLRADAIAVEILRFF